MQEDEKSTQLPLSVSVSPWSGFAYRVKKSMREFRYSSPVMVFSNFFFWANVGIVGIVGLTLFQNSALIEKGVGTVFPAGSSSPVPSFMEASTQNLSVLPYYWYAMIGLLALSSLLALLIHSFGRYTLTTFLFALVVVMQLVIAKVILYPIILLGGM